MRLLITGAAGIIGTVLTKGLKDRHELHGLDVDPMPLLDDATIGDISDFETVLASLSRDGRDDPSDDRQA